MKQTIKTALAIVLVLTALTTVGAKDRKRSCTVNLVGGGSVQGYFIGANSKQVIVEVNGARQVINLDHVTNILFIVDFKNRRMKDVEP